MNPAQFGNPAAVNVPAPGGGEEPGEFDLVLDGEPITLGAETLHLDGA